MVLGQSLQDGHDVVRLLVAEPQQDHAAVAAGRVGAGIAEAEVARDQRPFVGDGGGEYVGIGSAAQVFVGDGVDVVAESNERILGGDGDVSSSLSLRCWA